MSVPELLPADKRDAILAETAGTEPIPNATLLKQWKARQIGPRWMGRLLRTEAALAEALAANVDRSVRGHCPACGGTTLFIGTGGYITCSLLDCPQPDAASILFDDAETEHIVEITADDATLRHPLIERLADALFDCDLHRYIAGLDGPPRALGRYRVIRNGDRWSWLALTPPKETGR